MIAFGFPKRICCFIGTVNTMQLLSSKDNINVKNTVKLKNSAKYRRKSGRFIAEGVRICTDAVSSNAEIEIFFSTDKAMEKYPEDFALINKSAIKTYIVSDDIFVLMSDTETPQGFLCVIKALDKTNEFGTIKGNRKFVALDNIQDPSNLGTILRTAEALGIDGVIMSSDCCDFFSPKVVRGSMGAVFRLPFIICNSVCDFLSEHNELNSYAAVVTSNAQKITETNFLLPCVAVIGNEGNGLKAETIEMCNKKITIPMDGKAESLNASTAASIIMWEMVR